MKSLEVDGEAYGIKGKIRIVSAFPLTLQPCQHVLMREKKWFWSTPVYFMFHGDEDGKHVSTRTVAAPA